MVAAELVVLAGVAAMAMATCISSSIFKFRTKARAQRPS